MVKLESEKSNIIHKKPCNFETIKRTTLKEGDEAPRPRHLPRCVRVASILAAAAVIAAASGHAGACGRSHPDTYGVEPKPRHKHPHSRVLALIPNRTLLRLDCRSRRSHSPAPPSRRRVLIPAALPTSRRPLPTPLTPLPTRKNSFVHGARKRREHHAHARRADDTPTAAHRLDMAVVGQRQRPRPVPRRATLLGAGVGRGSFVRLFLLALPVAVTAYLPPSPCFQALDDLGAQMTALQAARAAEAEVLDPFHPTQSHTHRT